MLPKLDELMDLRTAAERVSRAHKTVARWASDGIAGVKLRCVRRGRERMTTEQWIVDFWAAVEAAHGGPQPPRRKRRHPKAPSARKERTRATLERHYPNGV